MLPLIQSKVCGTRMAEWEVDDECDDDVIKKVFV